MQRRSLASQSLDGVDSCFIIRALLGNSELLSLQKYWSVRVELLPKHGLVAYDFVYDPEGRELTIAPNYGSTDPADYPNQLNPYQRAFLVSGSASSIDHCDRRSQNSTAVLSAV